MSILLGPYDESGESKEGEDEDLFVFGYACKLYRDDVKAVMEGSGQLLIPWMGDSSLMVDRYEAGLPCAWCNCGIPDVGMMCAISWRIRVGLA